MEDGADHLVRNVLPAVPVRQWVLSFPHQVRFLVFSRMVDASRSRTAACRSAGSD